MAEQRSQVEKNEAFAKAYGAISEQWEKVRKAVESPQGGLEGLERFQPVSGRTVAKEEPQRLKTIQVGNSMLVEMLRRFAQVNLPKGAKIVSSNLNHLTRCLEVVVEHESYEEVARGSHPPLEYLDYLNYSGPLYYDGVPPIGATYPWPAYPPEPPKPAPEPLPFNSGFSPEKPPENPFPQVGLPGRSLL